MAGSPVYTDRQCSGVAISLDSGVRLLRAWLCHLSEPCGKFTFSFCVLVSLFLNGNNGSAFLIGLLRGLNALTYEVFRIVPGTEYILCKC